MTTFSERQGIIKDSNLDPKIVPNKLKNRLWNIIQDYIDNNFKYGKPNREDVIGCLWDKFFKENKNNLKGWDSCR